MPRTQPPTTDLAIIAADNKSHEHIGLAPHKSIPRMKIAEAVKKVHSIGVKVLFFDFTLQPDPDDPQADSALENALKSGPSVIVEARYETDRNNHETVYPIDPRFSRAASRTLPFKVITRNNVAYYINTTKKPAATLQERLPYLEPLKTFAGFAPDTLPNTYDLIHYYGGPQTIKSIPLFEVWQKSPQELAAILKDKIVFFGAADNKNDMHIVPSSYAPMDGVEIVATIAGNLMDGSFLRYLDLSDLKWKLIAGIIMIYVPLSLTTRRTHWLPTLLTLWAGLCGVGWVSVTYIGFAYCHTFISGFYAAVFIGLAAPLIAGGIAFKEARRQLKPLTPFLSP